MIYLFLVFLLVVYIGNTLGSAVLCETISELKSARELVWYIPLLNFLTIFYILLLLKGKKKFTYLFQYIKTPHKNITATYVVAQLVKERGVEAKSRHQQIREFFRESLSSYGKAIVLNAGG